MQVSSANRDSKKRKESCRFGQSPLQNRFCSENAMRGKAFAIFTDHLGPKTSLEISSPVRYGGQMYIEEFLEPTSPKIRRQTEPGTKTTEADRLHAAKLGGGKFSPCWPTAAVAAEKGTEKVVVRDCSESNRVCRQPLPSPLCEDTFQRGFATLNQKKGGETESQTVAASHCRIMPYNDLPHVGFRRVLRDELQNLPPKPSHFAAPSSAVATLEPASPSR